MVENKEKSLIYFCNRKIKFTLTSCLSVEIKLKSKTYKVFDKVYEKKKI